MNFPKLLAKKLGGELSEYGDEDIDDNYYISLSNSTEVVINTSYTDSIYEVSVQPEYDESYVIAKVYTDLDYGEFEIFVEISEELSLDRKLTSELYDKVGNLLSKDNNGSRVLSKFNEQFVEVIYNHIQTILDL